MFYYVKTLTGGNKKRQKLQKKDIDKFRFWRYHLLKVKPHGKPKFNTLINESEIRL